MARVTQTRSELSVKPNLISRLVLTYDSTLSGFAFDHDAPERHFTVEILLDGLVLRTSYADAFVPELFQQGFDGTYGFAVTIEPDLLRGASVLEARLANVGTPLARGAAFPRLDRQRNRCFP